MRYVIELYISVVLVMAWGDTNILVLLNFLSVRFEDYILWFFMEGLLDTLDDICNSISYMIELHLSNK